MHKVQLEWPASQCIDLWKEQQKCLLRDNCRKDEVVAFLYLLVKEPATTQRRLRVRNTTSYVCLLYTSDAADE